MKGVYGFDGYVVNSPAIAARKGCSTLKSRCCGSGALGATTVSWYGGGAPLAQTRSEYIAARSVNLSTSESSTTPVTTGSHSSRRRGRSPPGSEQVQG